MNQIDRTHKIFQKEPSHERDLWAAVIMQASEDCKMDDFDNKIKQHLRTQAKAWLWSHHDDIGSFRWICQHLDLPVNKVRALAIDGKLGTGSGEFSNMTFDPSIPRWKVDRAGYMREYRKARKAAGR